MDDRINFPSAGNSGFEASPRAGASALLWSSPSLWQAQKREAKERMSHRAASGSLVQLSSEPSAL